MTQLKGLLLAEGARAHLLQSGGSMALPCAKNKVPALNGSSAQPNPPAESVANLAREILMVQREAQQWGGRDEWKRRL